MIFKTAYNLMKNKGKKIKLPSWGGYWYWDNEKETIMIHTKDGDELDIRSTENVDYTISNINSTEWIIATDVNCPELGGKVLMTSTQMLKYLKKGCVMRRDSWDKDVVMTNDNTNSISVEDLLADDWTFYND